jgi:hypothetical protein
MWWFSENVRKWENVININNYEIFITFVIFMCIIHTRLW